MAMTQRERGQKPFSILGTSMPLKREREREGGGKGATSGLALGCSPAILMSLTRADGVEGLAPEQPRRRNERPMEIYVRRVRWTR